MKNIPQEIINNTNREILSYLNGRSCHGDIIEPLEEILGALSDVKSFCPDGKSFLWCCWYTQNKIFIYGVGMHEIAIRLPKMQSRKDKRPGSFRGRYDGDEWWLIKWDANSLKHWALLAYEYAKNT